MSSAIYKGDDLDDVKLTVRLAGQPVNFSTASAARWWMLPRGGGASTTPKTLTNGANGNDFSKGEVYPVMTAAETAALAANDYTVFVEYTLGGKVRTYAFSAFTFVSKGV